MDQLTGFGPGPISAGWATPNARRNRLLLALSLPDLSLLEPWLERVPLPVGTRLVEPNTPVEHACFLEEGIASVVATTPQGRRIEVGIIGREGLSGIPIADSDACRPPVPRRCRPPFRFDAGHRSEMKPATL